MENAITTILAIIINDAVAPVGAAGITGPKPYQQGGQKHACCHIEKEQELIVPKQWVTRG